MVQPPTGDQPQEPPFGGQQPPYDPGLPPGAQPNGEPYGQQPPYGTAPYGAGGYYTPPKGGNGFAIAGIILAVLFPILGLIFSIIGLTKSKARAGAGRALSIVGIVVSVIVGAGAATAIAVVGTSTAADPGCINAESSFRHMLTTINADDAAFARDQGNSSAEQADLNHFLNDIKTLQGQMTAAEAQAHHQSVKTQIAAVVGDLSTFNSSLQALAQGNTSQVSQLQAAGTKMQNDGNTLDSTCTSL